MLNLSDKRQHFRFPVYDDETGVKLPKKRNREFLKDILDDGFVYSKQAPIKREEKIVNNYNMDPVEIIDAPDYFGHDGLEDTEDISAAPKTQKTAFHEKRIKLDQKTVPVKNSGTYVEPEKKDYKSPQSSFSNKFFETDNYGNAKHQKTDSRRSKFESSYDLPGEKGKNIFQPKHIPASLIEDSYEEERPRHSRELIVDELRKASSDNLLLMEEEVILDPIIEEVEPVSTLINETPSLDKKKNQRLEKTLSGIIAEEGSTKLDSYYFD
ncbi:hypothetical protein [Vagococcus sp.]|uniref:hypothetical protein n=1 Tax=Vagococcus sp. TaxID=1933889 RepID=UPI002FCA731F